MISYKFVGGSLCLDFVNTVGGRAGGVVLREKIGGYTDLAAWGVGAKALTSSCARRARQLAAIHPGQARVVVARGLTFRESLYRIFKSVLERRPPRRADMNVLSRELSIARAHENLAYRSSAFEWALDNDGGRLDSVLWAVAASAAELLTRGDLSRLRQCGGHECGWFFLDTSRNRSRLWCDMRDCGNRAKVRRFRERQAR